MTEQHRLRLDPGIVERLAGSMRIIADAWAADVERLREAETDLLATKRALDSSNNRCAALETSLEAERSEVRRLLERNAYLEAPAVRGDGTTRDRPTPPPRARPLTSEPMTRQVRPRFDTSGADGTGLPQQSPEFIRRTNPPTNIFFPRHAAE